MSTTFSSRNAKKRTLVIELNKADLETAVRHVGLDPGRFMTARVRRRYSSNEIRLLLDHFQAVQGTPSGNQFPVLQDWAVVTCRHHGLPVPEEIPRIIEAARSQMVVCVSLDSDRHHQINVVIWDGGQLLTADVVRIVGSGGFEVPERSPDEPFDMTPQRREFFNRRSSRTQGAVGAALAAQVRTRRIALVGTGSGGSALATQIASLNPGRLMLIDQDYVEAENLNNLPHVAETDAEQQTLKVEALATAICANQPDLHVNAVPWSVTDGRSIRMLSSLTMDGFFSFVDNDTARICTNHLARECHAVHLDVGTLIRNDGNQRIMRADIRLFEPRQRSGCVLCVPEMSKSDRAAAFYELNAPSGSLHRGVPVEWNDPIHGRAGSLLMLNQLTAALAVDLWLAWLDGKIRASHWIRVTWPFGSTPKIESTDVSGAANCEFCGAE